MMSRVREETARRGLHTAVPVAAANTDTVITSDGLILAGTFAVLTILPLTLLYQFGVCVAVDDLLDTFVVRAARAGDRAAPGALELVAGTHFGAAGRRADAYIIRSVQQPGGEFVPRR